MKKGETKLCVLRMGGGHRNEDGHKKMENEKMERLEIRKKRIETKSIDN